MLSLVFDIGKTNKKYFIFDENFNIIKRQETIFPEIFDEDEFPCDDIEQLSEWLLDTFNKITEEYNISFVNFSTYGASYIHLDSDKNPITPLYNYLKPLPVKTEMKFLEKFKDQDDFSVKTSSPYLGMLNSALQLFWLKHIKPTTYDNIDISLHLPQYCSFLLSGKKVSEYTSIGCHTGLWDFNINEYHQWVKNEKLDVKQAQIVDSNHYFNKEGIKIGIGIHDSSAALIPYLIGVKERFVLISTGTWSICLNPFSTDPLTKNDLKNDCLNFIQPNGNPVKASRLFLGNELQVQLDILNIEFKKDSKHYQKVEFDKELYLGLVEKNNKAFYFKDWESKDFRSTKLNQFDTFVEAYHQLLIELVNHQISALKLAIGSTEEIETIFIDGGFANNDLFCKLLAIKLPQYRFKRTELASGSALGAAVILNKTLFNSEVFKNKLNVKEINVD